MQYRFGETIAAHFRADRFFCISGDWFFSSREDLKMGPFRSKDEAEIELMFYLRHVNEGGIYSDDYAAERTALIGVS